MKTLFSILILLLLAAHLTRAEKPLTEQVCICELPCMMSTTDVYKYMVNAGYSRVATYEEFRKRSESRWNMLDRDIVCFGSQDNDKFGRKIVSFWKYAAYQEFCESGSKKELQAWALCETMWPKGTYVAFIIDGFVF